MVDISHAVTVLLSLMFFVDALYGIVGTAVLPGGDGFTLVVLVLAAYLGGIFVKCLLRLPPLVGMLLIGILFRNVSLPFDVYVPLNIASSLRSVALVIILLKAGLNLDPKQLITLKWAILRLSFLPNVLATVVIAVLSHLLLGMPWLWAFMLGCILTPVSAAVLIPGALKLEEKEMGTRKGIPTLIMAAVSVDNVVALTGFFILFDVLKNDGGVTGWTMVLQLLEPFLGFLLGAAMGVLLWHVPAKRSDVYTLTYYQTLLLCLASLSFLFLSKRFGAPSVGAMGCVSLAFVASIEWRKHEEQFNRINWIIGKLWQLIEPFLFGLIGTQITIENLKNDIVSNILVLLGGAVTQVLAVFISLYKSSLNLKENTFVALSWISKATVQAAVGSDAIEFGRTEGKESQFVDMGEKVLTLSVLVIMVTAPLGAILMDCLGSILLENNKTLTTITTEESTPTRTESANSGTNYGSCNQEKLPV